jgi:hypothetical protein
MGDTNGGDAGIVNDPADYSWTLGESTQDFDETRSLTDQPV